MTEKQFIGSNGGVYVIEVEETFNLINKLSSENKKLKKENLDLSEELDYYKAKCASLETGLFQADKENKQLKMGIDSLKLLVKNWEALDEEKDEQLDKQNQKLRKLIKENEQLKQFNQKLNDELQETMGYLALKSGVEKENEQLKKIRDVAFELAEKPTQHTLWKFRSFLKEYNNER